MIYCMQLYQQQIVYFLPLWKVAQDLHAYVHVVVQMQPRKHHLYVLRDHHADDAAPTLPPGKKRR